MMTHHHRDLRRKENTNLHRTYSPKALASCLRKYAYEHKLSDEDPLFES
jgi:hypothetical protein